MSLISEHAIIRGDVKIGKSTLVEPFAVITGPCIIGDNCYIGTGAVIGAAAQHTGSYPHPITGKHAPAGVIIWSDVCVREYATVHQGLLHATEVGDRSLLMAGCHIAHDTVLGDDCVVGSYTLFGGFTFVGDHVTFGQGCVTHPWTVIGSGAMVGLNSSVIRDVQTLEKVAGCPAERLGGMNDRKREAVMTGSVGTGEFAALASRRDDLRDKWNNRSVTA